MNVFKTSGNNTLGPPGTGLAESAGDIKRLRAQWQREYINGETTLQFKEWVKGKEGNLTAMTPDK